MIDIEVSGPTAILRNFLEFSWSTENNQENSVTSVCVPICIQNTQLPSARWKR